MKKNKNYLFLSIGFGITILIVLFLIILYTTNNETFINNITFLTKEQSQIFLKNDEDNYIKNLSIYDLRARNVNTTEEYLSIAINSCLDFDDCQKNKLKICTIEAIKFFNNNYNWTFALTNNNYEEGLPHTRGPVIFLSPIILNYSNNELIKTLIHESIHIYQRYNKNDTNIYLEKNGYSVSKKRDKNSLIRANPDLDDFIYKDKNGNELMAYYTSNYPKGINDINLNSYMEEHPFEKMAYEIAEAYSKKLILKYKNI